MKTLVIEFEDSFNIDTLLKFLEDNKCTVNADVKTIHIPIMTICGQSKQSPEIVTDVEVPQEIIPENIAGTCEILDLSAEMPFVVSDEMDGNILMVNNLVTSEYHVKFNIGEMTYVMPLQMQTVTCSIRIGEEIQSCTFTPTSCDCEPSIIFSKTCFNQLAKMGDDSEVPAQ